MKYVIITIFLLCSLPIFSPKRIYIKVQSDDTSKHTFCHIYVTGLGGVMSQSLRLPIYFFLLPVIRLV